MQVRGDVRLIVSAFVLALAGVGMVAGSAFSAGCSDGATPDCTGDASASCGLLPNEGGAVDDGGKSQDGADGTDAGTDTDTGAVDMDVQTDDSGDDAGD